MPVCRGASAEEVSCGSGGEPGSRQRWPTGLCTRTAPSFLYILPRCHATCMLMVGHFCI